MGSDPPLPRRSASREGGVVFRVVFHVNLPPEGVAPIGNYPCGKAARRAALDHDPGRGRGADRRPVSFLEDALSRVSPGLLYALVAALSVELAAVSLLDFPAFGLVPILDLVSIETPRFYAVLRAWLLSRFDRRRLRSEPPPRGPRRSLFQPRQPRGARPIPRRWHGGAGAARPGPELARCGLSGRYHRGLRMGRSCSAVPPARGESPSWISSPSTIRWPYYTIRLWCLAAPASPRSAAG